MEIELTSTRVNPIIGRREVAFEVHGASTPRRIEVRLELADILKVDLERVWLRRLETRTGTNLTLGLAHIYDDAARALEVEPEHILRRNQPPQEAAEAVEE
ncbi:hypothetical protein AC482_01780 [miscellaneous Crenarchaeota group-15 archaeon DG-45]|uniref:Small ribosomal subunit protein eS24 n=1 Tax=miscellaneous Crenarchaeota group-15 archaeon DG-45 TaxID=1685127 RepID=A0A0M0BRS8_9ARCH|nr:MAG: hypothetical protein AC482_01780 [miscellaneous Crenarchaeota group-15 archaeon DG-45]